MAYTWTRSAAERGTRPVFDPASTSPVLAAAAAVSPAAAEALQQQRAQAGTLLVDLYRYLEAHAEAHPVLAPVLPTMRSAVADHRAGSSPDPLRGPRAVYDAILAARRTDGTLPDP